MPGPYDNAPGAALPGSIGASPDALNAAVDAYKPTDTSTFLAKLLAEKQIMSKLAVASDLQSQIEFEKTQKQADLAILKAKQAEAEMFVKNAPKHQAALQAEYEKTARDADAERAANAKTLGDAAQKGIDIAQYKMGDSYDYSRLAKDVAIIGTRTQRVNEYGWSTEDARKETPMTWEEELNTPVPAEGSLTTAPVPSSNTATDALKSPIPTGDTPAAGSSPSTDLPAKGPPVALPQIYNPNAGAAAGPLASAPTPGAATTAPAAKGPAATPAAAITGGPEVEPGVSLEDSLEAGRTAIARTRHIPPSSVTRAMLVENLGLTTTHPEFIDPATQNTYKAQVVAGRDGTIYKVGPPVLSKRNPEQQTIDTEAAKDYQDYVQNHGSARDENDLATLDESIKILKDPMTINASGAVVSLFPHALTALFTTDRSLKVPNMIKSVVQNHLKEIFGARLSNMEVKNAMELVFNEKVDETTNAETAGRLRETLGAALTEKRASMQYFGEHGTLAGYKPEGLQSKPADTRASTTTTSSSTAKAAPSPKVGDIGMRGKEKFIIEQDPKTGKYHWVQQ